VTSGPDHPVPPPAAAVGVAGRGAADRPSGLAAQPRIRLGTLPTPLLPAPRLSAAVGVEIWLKRDDLTGLGLGGNKVRGLEFLLADALARGCDTLVTGGGPGSNWAMLAALAARTRGLDTVLVCYGDPVPPVGNMALATTIGADIRFTENREIRALFAELAPSVVDVTLREDLLAASVASDPSLRISDLNEGNYALRRLLTRLQIYAEEHGALEAQKRIWAVLKALAQRRLVQLGP